MAKYNYIGNISKRDKQTFESAMRELEEIFKYPKVPSWKDATVTDYEVSKVVYGLYNDIDAIDDAINMNIRHYNQGGLSKAKSDLGKRVARISNDITSLTSYIDDLVSRMIRLQGTPKEASMIQMITYDSD